jgi:uncharacterized protein (TIGR01777 family)
MRMIPPWENAEVLKFQGIRDGEEARLKVNAPWPREWIAVHENYIPDQQFVDVQKRGPMKTWRHAHRFLPDPQSNPNASLLSDEIEYTPPGGPLRKWVNRFFVKDTLEKSFAYRQQILANDLEDHRLVGSGRVLKVAVTGASGLIGRALQHFLSTGGHEVRPIHQQHNGFDVEAIDGCDALVHLAGEPIAQRWNDEIKRKIRFSRVNKTRELCEAVAALQNPPKVLVSGSAIGIYGDAGDRWLDENAPVGDGFLAEVTHNWEEATKPAIGAGLRVCLVRTGIVLWPKGGALAKMLPAFRMAGGGPLGDGEQYLSWITLDDEVRIIHRLLMDEDLSGPFNAVAPRPVTSREFAKTLGKVLSRPAVLPAPRFALRAAFGEMADEALLASQRVEPRRLLENKFAFRHTELESALRWLLGRFAPAIVEQYRD